MKNKVFISTGILIIGYFLAWLFASPVEQLKQGEMIQAIDLSNIHGSEVLIPSTRSKWIHLQFRRFAGCPIRNLHLQSVVQRNPELIAAGIQEVVVFHSPRESLLPFQGNFPFDVIADPEKKLYAEFGVDSSIFSLLDVRAWPAIIKGYGVAEKPVGDPEGGATGRPADFLISSEGKIVALKYGRHAYDQWSVDDVLQLVQEMN